MYLLKSIDRGLYKMTQVIVLEPRVEWRINKPKFNKSKLTYVIKFVVCTFLLWLMVLYKLKQRFLTRLSNEDNWYDSIIESREVYRLASHLVDSPGKWVAIWFTGWSSTVSGLGLACHAHIGNYTLQQEEKLCIYSLSRQSGSRRVTLFLNTISVKLSLRWILQLLSVFVSTLNNFFINIDYSFIITISKLKAHEGVLSMYCILEL